MTDAEQRIAMAELHGFKISRWMPDDEMGVNWFKCERCGEVTCVELWPITLNNVVRSEPLEKAQFWWALITATPRQRVKALIIDAKKWKD